MKKTKKFLKMVTFTFIFISFFILSSSANAVTMQEFSDDVDEWLAHEMDVEQNTLIEGNISKKDAMKIILGKMGWEYTINRLEYMEIIPELSSRDLFSEMLCAIEPAVPYSILFETDEPLTKEDYPSLQEWVEQACKTIRWSATYYGDYTALTIVKRGTEQLYKGKTDDISTNNNKPFYMAYITIDTDKVSMEIAPSVMIGSPKASLSTISEENYGVIGGINGGYFSGNTPIGVLRRQGQIENGSFYPYRSAFGWNNKKESIFVDGHDVADIKSSSKLDKYTELMQGGPLLIKNGKISHNHENIQKNVINGRHPRTFVGEKDNKIIWGVIDGRDNMHSIGVTLDELRKECIAIGLKNALNLDGGGSSSLMWRDIIITKPSNNNEQERPIPYAILFFREGYGVRN